MCFKTLHSGSELNVRVGEGEGGRKIQTGFLLGNVQERFHLEGLDEEEIGWDKIRMNSSTLEYI